MIHLFSCLLLCTYWQSKKINRICNICYFVKGESCANGSRSQFSLFPLPPHPRVFLYWTALGFLYYFIFSEWKRTDWANVLARTHQHSSIIAYLVFNRFEISPNIWPNYSLSYSHTSVSRYSLFITLNNSLSSLASTLLKHFRAEVTFFSLLLKQILRT